MTTLRQSCYYYISLFNFIKMFFLFFRSVWAHISFLNVQSFLNVCLYTVQSVIEHPKTTSVSQPDSKKIQGLIGVHISFVAKNSFLTYVYIQFGTEFFTTKQPLIPRLAQKNKGRIRVHISFVDVQSFLNVCLYTVQSVAEHQKKTSVSQPDSKKIQGLIGGHISFWGGKPIPHVCLYALQNRIFPIKQPLIPRLAQKIKWPV